MKGMVSHRSSPAVSVYQKSGLIFAKGVKRDNLTGLVPLVVRGSVVPANILGRNIFRIDKRFGIFSIKRATWEFGFLGSVKLSPKLTDGSAKPTTEWNGIKAFIFRS